MLLYGEKNLLIFYDYKYGIEFFVEYYMYYLDNIVFFLLVEECKLYVYILYFSEIDNLLM